MSAATPTPPAGPIPPAGPPPAAPPTGIPPTLPSVPGAPAPAEAPHHHGKTEAELAAEEIQDNALYRGLKAFWAKAKSGQLLPSKALAVIVVVVVAGGLYWWFSGQSLKADSHRWADLLRANTPDKMNTFATENASTGQALLARRNRALLMLGTDGTAKLDSKSSAEWKKAVLSVEAARDELTTLADLYKKDRGLKAACLRDAAVAERALIGAPKKGPPDENLANQRGTAAKVAELYRAAAAAIGANTASGEKYAKEAADVEANAATILSANAYFYSRVAPEGFSDTPAVVPTPNPTPGANPNPQTPSTSRTPSTGK